MTFSYSLDFYRYERDASMRAAGAIVPLLRGMLQPESVLDVGCGCGCWVEVWRRSGVEDVLGLDLPDAAQAGLVPPPDLFRPTDLAAPFSLGRRFDLVQSLEVAEHLPEESAAAFIESLVAHGPLVLFSAAPPGQGGDGHVNEQPYDYWRRLFARHGYAPHDCLRDRLRGIAEAPPWLRHNMLLYVHAEAESRLPEAVRRTRVADGLPIADVSPPTYRLRKAAVRALPRGLQQFLARRKAFYMARLHRGGN